MKKKTKKSPISSYVNYCVDTEDCATIFVRPSLDYAGKYTLELSGKEYDLTREEMEALGHVINLVIKGKP